MKTTVDHQIGDIARLNRPGHPWHKRAVLIVSAYGEGYLVKLRRILPVGANHTHHSPSISINSNELFN